jgi:hypothetical protein
MQKASRSSALRGSLQRKRFGAKIAEDHHPSLGTDMKLSIKAELVYSFAQDTQIIASLEASQTSDQTILSGFLDVQPPAQLLFDKTPYGDRSMRASLSGEVTIRYEAVVEKASPIAAANRSSACMVRPSGRCAAVSPAWPVWSIGQVHAVCAT